MSTAIFKLEFGGEDDGVMAETRKPAEDGEVVDNRKTEESIPEQSGYGYQNG